jgi:AcrR family transcriptional regulator
MVSVEDMTATLEFQSVDDGATVDGRTMRRKRNRMSVINALLSMIREGDLHPAASDIADRAGVSHRSIFRYFDDLDDLVRTTIAQAFREVGALNTIPDIGQGELTGRIERFVDARLKLLEFVDRPMQLARARAHSIPSIDDQLSSVAELLRAQIQEHFEPELSKLDESVRAAVVDAVLLLTSYDSYYGHIRIIHDDIAQLRTSWNLSLARLLRT